MVQPGTSYSGGIQMSLVQPPRFFHNRSSRDSSAGKRKVRLRLEALEDRTLPSSISGTVFNDLNGDGLQGADEPGLQNWVVDLFQGQTRIQQLLNGTNGNFSFNVDPGAYTVQEETQTSWLLTST